MVIAASGAWLVLIFAPHSPAAHATTAASHHATAAVAMSLIMTAAMMLPLTLGAIRHVASSSLWRRRQRAILLFVLGYLAVTAVAEVLLIVLAGAASGWLEWWTAGLAAASAAALWELTPMQRRNLRRCWRTAPLAPSGWRADRDCLCFGTSTAGRCLGTCLPLMLAAAAFAPSALVMAVLFGVQVSGRYRVRHSPRAAALAVTVVCLSTIARRTMIP